MRRHCETVGAPREFWPLSYGSAWYLGKKVLELDWDEGTAPQIISCRAGEWLSELEKPVYDNRSSQCGSSASALAKPTGRAAECHEDDDRICLGTSIGSIRGDPVSRPSFPDGVVAQIVSSTDGGPLRQMVKGRSTKVTGAFVSFKAGSRSMPWESKDCELPAIELAEVASPVVRLLAQPRLELCSSLQRSRAGQDSWSIHFILARAGSRNTFRSSKSSSSRVIVPVDHSGGWLRACP